MNIPDSQICFIIVAAGTGSRFGAPLPKQFCDMPDGRPVLLHTLEALGRCLPGAGMLLVLSEPMMPLWEELCERHGVRSPEVVAGGESRAHSVANALKQAAGRWPFVAIHDGARPNVAPAMIRNICTALARGASGVVPAVPVTDSLREREPGGGSVAVDRSRFLAVQTPQAFPYPLISDAYARHANSLAAFTDDASLLEADGGLKVELVEGDPANIKITRPADLLLADALINVAAQ